MHDNDMLKLHGNSTKKKKITTKELPTIIFPHVN
jgi:hypothetical protein